MAALSDSALTTVAEKRVSRANTIPALSSVYQDIFFMFFPFVSSCSRMILCYRLPVAERLHQLFVETSNRVPPL